MYTRSVTWNARNLYRAGSLKTLASELLGNLKGRDHLEDLGVDGKIIQ
jgi:hypothetical protein